MANMLCLFGFDRDIVTSASLWEAIDPIQNCNRESIFTSDVFCLLAYHRDAPYAGLRIFENDQYFACLDGDLAGINEIPWSELAEKIASGFGDDVLRKYKGIFAIAVFDKRKRVIFGVSDRLGQHPLYYHHAKDKCIW